jgi:hypothetical protein
MRWVRHLVPLFLVPVLNSTTNFPRGLGLFGVG